MVDSIEKIVVDSAVGLASKPKKESKEILYSKPLAADPEDSASYQRILGSRPIGTDGVKEGYNPHFSLGENIQSILSLAEKFSYLGSGVKADNSQDAANNESGTKKEERKEPIGAQEFVRIIQDIIGEEVMRTGRRLSPEDKERLASVMNCDPTIKNVWRDFAERTAAISTRDYSIRNYMFN